MYILLFLYLCSNLFKYMIRYCSLIVGLFVKFQENVTKIDGFREITTDNSLF
jgi:hypothetical protein